MKIYTPREVAAGEIGSVHAIEQVMYQLRQAFAGNEDVRVAQLFGSCANERYGIGSDVDVVVIPTLKRRRAVESMCIRLVDTASELYVPLNIELQSPVLSERGNHSLTFGMWHHISRLERHGLGTIRGSFLETVTCPQQGIAADIHSYAVFKYRQMQCAILAIGAGKADDAQIAHWLQDALDLPVHLFRKILTQRGKLTGHDDSKTVVIAETESGTLPKGTWRKPWVDLVYEARVYRVFAEGFLPRPNDGASNRYRREFFTDRKALAILGSARKLVESCLIELL